MCATFRNRAVIRVRSVAAALTSLRIGWQVPRVPQTLETRVHQDPSDSIRRVLHSHEAGTCHGCSEASLARPKRRLRRYPLSTQAHYALPLLPSGFRCRSSRAPKHAFATARHAHIPNRLCERSAFWSQVLSRVLRFLRLELPVGETDWNKMLLKSIQIAGHRPEGGTPPMAEDATRILRAFYAPGLHELAVALQREPDAVEWLQWASSA